MVSLPDSHDVLLVRRNDGLEVDFSCFFVDRVGPAHLAKSRSAQLRWFSHRDFANQWPVVDSPMLLQLVASDVGQPARAL